MDDSASMQSGNRLITNLGIQAVSMIEIESALIVDGLIVAVRSRLGRVWLQTLYTPARLGVVNLTMTDKTYFLSLCEGLAMQRTAIWISLVGVGSVLAFAAATQRPSNSQDLLEAISARGDHSALIAKLRAAGPPALEQLFQVRQQLASAVNERSDASRLSSLREQLARLDELIDQVGMQRYCSRSQLYWYTDFEAAKQAARASGKPILSLRLLGNLNEDFSCANSRFFRTTLYANQEISEFLREKFILHWRSMRPVPKVTIDFGDGRRLQRTLTGNSVHYVLTPEGAVVDGIPGLYGPQAFLRQIREGWALAKQVGSLSAQERHDALIAHHQERFAKLGSDWTRDVVRARGNSVSPVSVAPPDVKAYGNDRQPPAANVATAIARPKAWTEATLVRAALPLSADPMKLDDEEIWKMIAALHTDDARLDSASRDLINSQSPSAAQAAQTADTKRRIEDPLVRMVQTLESSIAIDTVKNEYRLHRAIHQWLGDASSQADIDTLNERVYSELFLTPGSDPWLGLAPADVYTALPGGGVVGN
jgi:hypothetical protein